MKNAAKVLSDYDELTATSNAVTMFIEKSQHPVPDDHFDAEGILLEQVQSSIDHGAGQWFYDTGAGNVKTLAVSLDEPYDDLVALLRYDEHRAPSEGFEKSYAVITVMPRARAHRAQQDGRWVRSPSIAADFVSRPTDPDHLLLTYLSSGRWQSEILAPEVIPKRVAELIADGADPLSFVRWKRLPPEERKVDVVVRY